MSNNTTHTIADDIRNFITDYVSLPSEAHADVLALYAMHTYAFDAARTTPYIYITSTGPGSGKTRLMEVMQCVTRDDEMFSGMTGPVMFRMIEAIKPTLFLDEVDTIYSGAKNEELRGVLNSGYKHNGSIARVDAKDDAGYKRYSTFCPKVLAGIDNGQVPATVMDRSIVVRLSKATAGDIKPFYSEDVEELTEDISEDIRTWTAANMDALKDRSNRPAAIEGLSDRQNDIARPLLTIADRLPGWGKRARLALLRVFSDIDTPLSPQQAALSTIREYMLAHKLERITSARAVELTGLNGKQLGGWLTAFGVTAGTYSFKKAMPEARSVEQHSDTRAMHKGYVLNGAMEAAWDRYLPALPPTIADTE
jgi:hypothetical protein